MQLTGINRRYISEACNGIRDLAGGYHWEWANKEVKVDME